MTQDQATAMASYWPLVTGLVVSAGALVTLVVVVARVLLWSERRLRSVAHEVTATFLRSEALEGAISKAVSSAIEMLELRASSRVDLLRTQTDAAIKRVHDRIDEHAKLCAAMRRVVHLEGSNGDAS